MVQKPVQVESGLERPRTPRQEAPRDEPLNPGRYEAPRLDSCQTLKLWCTQLAVSIMRGFPKSGALFWDLYNTDYSILRSIPFLETPIKRGRIP